MKALIILLLVIILGLLIYNAIEIRRCIIKYEAEVNREYLEQFKNLTK